MNAFPSLDVCKNKRFIEQHWPQTWMCDNTTTSQTAATPQHQPCVKTPCGRCRATCGHENVVCPPRFFLWSFAGWPSFLWSNGPLGEWLLPNCRSFGKRRCGRAQASWAKMWRLISSPRRSMYGRQFCSMRLAEPCQQGGGHCDSHKWWALWQRCDRVSVVCDKPMCIT